MGIICGATGTRASNYTNNPFKAKASRISFEFNSGKFMPC